MYSLFTALSTSYLAYMDYNVDKDIRKAKTLSSAIYKDPTIFKQIISSFKNQWLFATHTSNLTNNNVMPLHHIEHILNESMILTKNDNIYSCLSNVCTHRGMLICDEGCSTSVLRCRYHGRTFSLDGHFSNMPEFEKVEDFPSSDDNLNSFPLKSWKGLLFTGLNVADFQKYTSFLDHKLSWMPIEDFSANPSSYRSYDLNANWALYVDNYLEGFHIPFVHSDLHDTLDYDEYQTELFDNGVLQIGIARENEPHFDLPSSSPDYGLKVAAYYFWLFPNIMLNYYPWGLSVNVVIPLDVDKTKIVYHGYVWNEELLHKGAGADLDKVEAEDQDIVEKVQRGIQSNIYVSGRYSPTKETGVHHFHRLLSSSLSNE